MPTIFTPSSCRNGQNSPMALLPPPTHAMSRSGSRPSFSKICRRDAVLPRARLGDDALLAHAPREEDLPERVVDLVRAGVEQVLALQVNLRAPELLREAFGKIERCGPSDVVAEQAVQFGVESGI